MFALAGFGWVGANGSDLDVAFDADARLFGLGQAVAIQPDGKVVVAGSFAHAGGVPAGNIARYNADGSIDQTFSAGTALNGQVRAMALQADGKLIVAGNFTAYGATARLRIARLNADGTLDSTFDPGTGLDGEVLDLALQSDGKVIVVGGFTTAGGIARNRVARFNANGTHDTTFTPGTGANGVVWDVALQGDGKPVVVGAFTTFNGTTRNRIARLTTAGALDTGIAFTGGANQDIYGVALDSGGRFVIGGFFTTWNGTARKYIARLTAAGALDTTFDPGATSFDDIVFRVAHDSAGRVIAVGRMLAFNAVTLPMPGVARLTTTGVTDTGFSPAADAFALARARLVEAIAVGPGDSLVIVGSQYHKVTGVSGVTILTAAGVADAVFNPGRGLTFAPRINAVRPGRNGTYYVVGEFDWIGGAPRADVVRFLPNAQVDPAFVPTAGFGRGTHFDAPVLDAVELPNGYLWVFGAFTKYGLDFNRPGAALFSAGGSPEITATTLTIGGGAVRRALLGVDGKVTLAGTFTAVNGTARAGVARVLTTGALDTAFAPGSGPTGGEILDASMDASGRVLVAGSFTGFSGTAEPHLVRLDATGAVDTAYAASTAVSAQVNSVQALSGDQALIGGLFANSGGFAVNGVDRLNADGTSDGTFNPGAGANSYVYAARADAAGRIGLAGAFTAVRGESRPGGLARLASGGTLENLFTATALAGGYATDLFERPDGKLLVSGTFTGVDGAVRAGLARFHSVPVRRGSLVIALEGAALAAGDVRAVVPMADGGFVLAGDFTSAAGAARNRIVKLTATGQLDAAFAYTSGFNASVQGGLAEPDGRALLWGAFASYNGAGASGVARINADGTRDTGFNPPTFNSTVHAVLRLPDGRYLVAGAFTSANATLAGGLVRLNADGTLDNTFNAGTGANGALLALARAGDGTVFAGGAFTTFAGTAAPGVVKLMADGPRAAGFDIGTGNPTTATPVRALALQADGKLLVGGSFTIFNGATVARMIRLNADGSLDATFLGGLGADAAVNALAPISDGRIFVAGAFTSLGGGERRGLARLGADGRIDPVLDVGTGFNNEVFNVTPLADGRLAVAGKFTSVSGSARNRFALLYAADEGVPNVVGDAFQTIEVNPGQGFELSLGAPVAGLNYQWYRDGVLLPAATASTYTVAAAGLGDLGTYTTVISNGAGEFTTAGTQVIVRLAPVVTSAPVAQAVGYGAGVTFSVSVSGPGPFTYQWYRNGEAMAGATASSLALANVGDTDFGDTFFVRITNSYGTYDTPAVALTFDPAAVPGALVRAFPTQNPSFTSPAQALVRTAGGQYYVGTGAQLRRLNADGSVDAAFAPAFSNLSVGHLALQSDGKLIVAGYLQPTGGSVVSLLRLLPSGAVDPTFAPPAINTFSIQALALQADGKIVVGGSFTTVGATARRYLARLNIDGTLDATFAPIDDATAPNTNGYVRAIHVQGTNLIIAGDFTTYRGTTVNRLVRVTSTNALDGTFAGGTRGDGPIQGLLVQPDGKLFIRGAFTAYNGTARSRLARLNADGSLDTTFDAGPGPMMASNFDAPTVLDFALGDGGSLILTGNFDSFSGWPAADFVRLTPVGAIDTQWAAPAFNVSKLLPASDGQLFVGGYFTIPGLTGTQYFARLLGGTFPPQPPSFITQPQGNAYVYPAGSRRVISGLATGPGTLTFQWLRNGSPVSDSTIISGATTPMLTIRSLRTSDAGSYTLRVTSSTQGAVDSQPAQINVGTEPTGPGSLDLTWAADNALGSFSVLYAAADGSHYAAPRFYDGNQYVYYVQKFDANGVLQPPSVFQSGVVFDGGIYGLERQSDGKVVVAGYFTTASGTARAGLARLNANGTLDTGFNPNPATAGIQVLVQQGDGKLLVGGSFTTIAGSSRTAVARLLAAGTIDTTFVPGAHGLTEVERIRVAADGKVYILGRNNTTNTDDIVRLTTTGAIDGTFVRVTAASNSIRDFALDGSGRVLVVGEFSTINGQARNRIARFSSAGALDANFGSARSAGAFGAIEVITIGPDGYHYLATANSSYDGFGLGPLIRLDPNGILDPNFPAASAGRINNLSSPLLGWAGGKLVLVGSFSGLSRSQWVRINTDGGLTGAPVLLESTGDRTVVEGLGVGLSARFGGTGPFTYAWRFNGNVVAGATGPQLWLPSPTSADAGSYTLTATNGSGSQTATMNLNFFAADPLSPTAGIALAGNINGSVIQLIRLVDESVLVAGSFKTVAGVNSPGIARILADGTLDTAFAAALPLSTTGSVPSIVTMAREADGRILLHGYMTMTDDSTAYLVRLNANGSLAGVLLNTANVSTMPARMALQPDGGIVVAGNFTTILGASRAGLARLLANGTLDPAFQSAGIVSSGGFGAIHVDAAGQVLLSGNFISVGGVPAGGRIVRLNQDGTLDQTFSTALSNQPDGFFRTGDGRLFAFGPSNLAQLAGRTVPVVQLNQDGSINPAFIFPFQTSIRSMGVDAQGRLHIAHYNSTGQLVRLLPGGLPERSVTVYNYIDAMLPAGDRLLVAGGNQLGSINGTSVPGIAYVAAGPASTLAVLQSPSAFTVVSEGADLTLQAGVSGPAGTTYQWYRDGNALSGAIGPVLVIPDATPAINGVYTLVASQGGNDVTSTPAQVAVQANLTRPGEIDLAWGAGRSVSGVSGLVRDASANLYLYGNVQINGGTARPLVALAPDGTVRGDFALSARIAGAPQTVVPLNDGKLLVGGGYSSLKLDNVDVAVVRLNANGSVDDSFTAGVVNESAVVLRIQVLASGQILVMGSFTTYGGTAAQNIMRLSAEGVADATFTGETVDGSSVRAVLPAPGGKYWYFGQTQDYTAGTRRNFHRLNADGTRDTTFTAPLSYAVEYNNESLVAAAPALDGGFYSLTSVSSSPQTYTVRRITPQGVYDAQFRLGRFDRSDGSTEVPLRDIASDAFGRILLVGEFTRYEGVVRNGVVRLLPDGTPDLSFHTPLPVTIQQYYTPSQVLVAGTRVLVYGGNLNNYGGLGDRSGLYALVGGELAANTAPVLSGTVPNVSLPAYNPLALGLPVIAPADATIQWYRDNVAIPGATGTSYRLRSAGPADGGTYHATVEAAGVQLAVPAVTVALPVLGYSGALSARNAAAMIEGTVRLAVPQADGRILVVGDGVFVNGQGPYELFRLNADGTFHGGLPTHIRTTSNNASPVQAALVDADGRIYLAGEFTKVNGLTRNRVARLLADGSVDAAWDAGTGPNSTVNRLALAPDGKLIIGGSFSQVAGTARQFLARLGTDGVLDTTFVVGTGLNNVPLALLVQADGRVVAGGNFTSYNGGTATRLVRLETGGALDATFAPAPNASVTALMTLLDGRIVAGGTFGTIGGASRTGLALLSTNGVLLEPAINFSSGFTAFAPAPDGGFFALSSTQVHRVSSTGVRDTVFTNANSYRGNFTNAAATPQSVNPTSLVTTTGSEVLVAGPFSRSGTATRNGLAWLGAADSLAPVITSAPADTTLPEGGSVNWSVGVASTTGTLTYTWTKLGDNTVLSTTSTLSRTNVTIAQAGGYRVMVSNGEGTVEATAQLTVIAQTTPTPGSPLLGFFAPTIFSPSALAPAGDGKWWVLSGNVLRRLLPDGSADSSYTAPTITGGSIIRFWKAPDGRLYVAGNFSAINGQSVSRLARFTAEGAFDPSFNTPLGSLANNPSINVVEFASNGRIYVGGSFTGLLVAGRPTNHLVRLLESGAVDDVFDPVGGMSAESSSVTALNLLSDGRILVGGNFTSAAGVARKGLVRFNADGSLDLSFNNIDISGVTRIARLSDGRLMVAGGFSTVDGLNRQRLARLGADGVVDPAFAVTAVTLSNVSDLIVRPDGRLVVLSLLLESGNNRARLLQLLPDGGLDPTFDYLHLYNSNASGTTGTFSTANMLPDGNLLVAGSFALLDTGIARNGLVLIKGSPLPPAIITAPASATVAGGSATELAVTVSGTPPFTYEWRRNGVLINGADAAILSFAGITAGEAGDYTVTIANEVGEVTSAAATLTVTQTAQSITFDALPDVTLPSAPIGLTATSSSGLTVNFTLVSGPASLLGSTLTLTGPGEVTVRATQPGNAAYLAATPVEHTFTVAAAQTGFAVWQDANFTAPELANASFSGPTADPDGDGFNNLMEYALGLEPKSPSASGVPEVSTNATYWLFTYTRPTDRTDVTYTVQFSTNLTQWTTVAVGDVSQIGSTASTVTIQARQALTTANVFFRLKVATP